MSYAKFLERKTQLGDPQGFEPLWMPDYLFDFQQYVVEYALRQGRAAVWADCGLGKTPMQLVWAENVRRYTGGNVLIATPLAVSHQTVREAEKFGIEVNRSDNGQHKGGIVVTNYERLHHFDASQFIGMCGDESSGIKDWNAKRRQVVTEFMRPMEYRLLCTATAAPNDYWEVGTSSEALGFLGWRDMITKFFKQEQQGGSHAWGRMKYRFRGHAEIPFWRWVCSWARALRKPSDLGFDDTRFILPELIEQETVVKTEHRRNGMLFAMPANGLKEEREERRMTLHERCEFIANAVNASTEPNVIWCHLNDEGDLLAKLIKGAEQVKGSMSDEAKESRLLDFTEGRLKDLVIKPKIGCHGLNWQHCANVWTFPSHSYEQYYQLVRRCYRFGQKRKVKVNIVATEGEQKVLVNLKRKAGQADAMFSNLVAAMANALHIDGGLKFSQTQRMPTWST